MPQEVTNEELALAIAKGFSGVDKSFEVVGAEIAALRAGLDKVEDKLDRVLVNELDRHDRWIKQLAAKVGIELVR